MNQYLLLRNNKKSGPYSASELASMGLKPFDLIWMEGKSAAWRYPGEIDELKSFAPPVEEQPYDRFFHRKGPGQDNTTSQSIQPTFKESRQSLQEPPSTLQGPQPRNISHPNSIAGNEKNNHARIFVAVPEKIERKEDFHSRIQNKESSGQEKEFVALQANTDAGYIKQPIIPDPVEPPARFERNDPGLNKTAKTNLKAVYWSIAAMIIFALATTFIYLNYQEQEKQLKKLNELVLNMQQNQPPETNPLTKNVVATFPIDASSVVHDSLKTEMTLVPLTEKPTVKKAVVKKKPAGDSSVLNHTVKTDSVLEPEGLPEKNIPEEKSSIRKEINRRNIGQLVNLSTNKYKVGLLGGVSDLQLTLTNKSHITFDKIEVQLEFLGPENKVVKTQKVLFENVASGSAMTLDIPRSGRGVSVKYNIASIQKEDEVIALF